jgi:adenylate cyclase
MDFAAEGLLDGLEGEERRARERLLARLVQEGFTLEELQAGVREDRLPLLLVERVLGGRYTARELEEQTGLPTSQLLRMRRLLGLSDASPDDHVFGEEEIAAAQSTRLFLEAGLGEEAIAEITRVLGEGMARLASTTAPAFVSAFLQAGDTEDQVAERFATTAQRLIPAIDPVLCSAYKQHLAESVQRGMLSRAERESGEISGAHEITVCFADIVGFTRLGAEVEAQQLGSLAGKLAELASEVTEAPVRLIKTIGDAALFVSPEPAPVVAVALALLDRAQEVDLPSLRAGIAYGPALQRAGDFYGHAVNLASRVTGVARPESVLCTKEVHDAAADAFEWSFARRHKLKGMSEPVALYRARWVGGSPDHEREAPAQATGPRDADGPSGRRDGPRPKKRTAGRRRTRASS